MNKAQIIALYDQYERIDVTYPEMRREVTAEVVRHVDTSGRGDGMVIYSRLNEANADEIIDQQVRHFEFISQGFEWKVYDYDPPPDLKERLAAFGFIVEDAEALLVLDLEDAPEILWQPVGHDVQRIIDPAKLTDVQAIEEQVWNDDHSRVIAYLGEALRNYPNQMSVYLAQIDGQPASAAWIYFPETSQFASLWGGATVSGYRERGLYTALLAVRAQEARDRGVRYLTVDASPMSRPILEKFGFQMIASTYPCKWVIESQKSGAGSKE